LRRLLELKFKDQGVLTMALTMMTRKAAAIGLAFAASALIAAPAVAQEAGVIRSILGAVGLVEPDRPAIEYRERAPLVVPPSRDLPPPADALSANPQWPDDATQRAERDRLAGPGFDRNETRPLTIDEIRAGRRVGGGGVGITSLDDDVVARPLTREEMRRTHRDDDRAAQGLTRRYLSDPPSALLQPAPSN
jgi:hypothetical protein